MLTELVATVEDERRDVGDRCQALLELGVHEDDYALHDFESWAQSRPSRESLVRQYLDDDEPRIARAAAAALGRLRVKAEPRMVEAWWNALQDGSERVRAGALVGLKRCVKHQAEWIVRLRRLVGADPSDLVRSEAEVLIGRWEAWEARKAKRRGGSLP